MEKPSLYRVSVLSMMLAAVSSLDNSNLPLAVKDHLNGGTQYGPIESWDTSEVTDMSSLFFAASNFNSNISQWNTSKVTDMRSMFYLASQFNADLSQWDVSKVTNMFGMFFAAVRMNSNISGWDVSKVTYMDGMFTYAQSFDRDIRQWDVSNVDTTDHMFYGASSFPYEVCWNPPSSLDMFVDSPGSLGAFPDCIVLDDSNIQQAVNDYVAGNSNYGAISQWNTSRVTNMDQLFYELSDFDEDISQWDVSNVTSMKDMFYFATAFNSNISQWNVSNVTTSKGMFGGAWSFKGELSQWDVSKVIDMQYMFMNARSFDSDLDTWATSQVSTMNYMFGRAASFNGNISTWDVSSVTDMEGMFMSAEVFNQDLNQWDVSKVTSFDKMFNGAISCQRELCWDSGTSVSNEDMFVGSPGKLGQPSDCWVLTDDTIKQAVSAYIAGHSDHGPISKWNTSLVTDMKGLFYLSDNFDGDISQWDVSNVTTMEDMFYFATSFNSNLSQWDVSKVTSMKGMFGGAWSFNKEISQWDVSKVTTMEYMYMSAHSFNSDISQWDVSKVTNMEGMFGSAKWFNSDLSQWDVSNVSYLQYMFMYAHAFNGDLSQWNVKNVLFMDYMFYDARDFQHELCWESSASMVGLFDGSSGSFCNSNTYVPTSAPIRRHTFSPTTTPITPPPHTSTPKDTYLPTSIPTAKSNPGTYINANISKTFRIMSGLSMSHQTWCLYAANNALLTGTVMAIDECQSWASFKWTIDYEGKIVNYKDSTLCIQINGNRMTLETCLPGSTRQMWFYNNNKRFLSVVNGQKGMVVANGVASKKAQVKALLYEDGSATDSELWEIQYDTAIAGSEQTDNTVPNFTGLLYVPRYEKFIIMSQLSNTASQWCLYPANNSATNGMKIAISQCQTWKSYIWTMDVRGNLISFKDPTKCMSRSGMRLQIDDCDYGNISQRFAYSVLDHKIVTLKDGRKQATVMGGSAKVNAQVKLDTRKIELEMSQMWNLVQV